MRRRTFLGVVGIGLVGCTISSGDDDAPDPEPDAGAGTGTGTDLDASAPADAGADACVADTVLLHDTYMQALYLDGSNGPLTGICEVEYVMAGAAVTLDFWHGHGGVDHRFTLGPTEYAQLLQHQRVTVTTTMVDGHQHTLFIDPTDEDYRVPGAPDVAVPIGC